MIWLLLDAKVDSDGHPLLEVKSEIPEEEVIRIRDCFDFCGPYNTMKMAINVAIRNGNQLQLHMHPMNLNRYRTGKKYDDAITIANQYALNYATSIKSFIDFTERQLRKKCSETDLEAYQKTQSTLYDDHFEYRFWMRLRNYIVHRSFPYSNVEDSLSGVKVQCPTKRLLEYEKWNTVRDDLVSMGEYVEPEKTVYKMNALLTALRIDYLSYFAGSIISALETYHQFCRSHGITNAMFCQVEKREDIAKGNFHANPMPIDILHEAFNELKMNPRIKFDIVDEN